MYSPESEDTQSADSSNERECNIRDNHGRFPNLLDWNPRPEIISYQDFTWGMGWDASNRKK